MCNKVLYTTKTQGFTLVELSIVIIIIGFLIAGIAAGTSLIKQAKLNAVINESKNYRTAIFAFRMTYPYFPGDLPYAESFWPNDSTANGNGDGNIDFGNGQSSEDKNMWSHLSLAHVVAGSYSGGLFGSATDAYYAFGKNAPGSSYKNNVGYAGQYYSQIYNNTNINAIIFGSPNGGAYFSLNAGGMIPADANSIDNKIDDGNAGTGLLLASTGYGGSGCTNVPWWGVGSVAGDVAYTLTDTNYNCMIYFVLQN